MISLFGSCRLEEIDKITKTSDIKNEISYTHSTKEVLQLINYLINNNLTNEEISKTFRTGIIKNKLNNSFEYYNKQFKNSDIFFIEITSKKIYKYNNNYVHHILYDDVNYNKDKNDILFYKQDDNEIIEDINNIVKLLNNKVIFVGHILDDNDNSSERFLLNNLVKKICLFNNILFIDPRREFYKLNFKTSDLVKKENITSHYNEKGLKVINNIYNIYINNYKKYINYFINYNIYQPKIRLGTNGDGGYVIIDNLNYDLLVGCGINNDINFEFDFCNKYNVKCLAFDGTINNLPKIHKNITFIKKNIGIENSNTTDNLLNILNNYNNIFLKMDIETWEYHWFNIVSLEQLNNISQMVIEFHYTHLDNELVVKCFNDRSKYLSQNFRINILKKICKTHILVHFHCNNSCKTCNYNNVILPNVYECTFIRKDLVKNISYNYKILPDNTIDIKNSKNDTEIILNYFPFIN
jgi:hypothetical protein